MLYLVNYILPDYTNKEAHFYFLLCMRGSQTLEYLVHDSKNMQDLGTREPKFPDGWRGESVALFTNLIEGEDEANVIKLPSHQI